MSSVLTSLLAFLVAIGILVAVHEWGHFIVARLCGVKVLRFSIGFGRPLWTRRSGPDGTEYCISAIPVGGYVRLLDEREGDIDPRELHRTFNRQPVAARVAILFAGPAMNFVFAVMAYWIMFVVGVPGSVPIVGAVEPASIAARAGLEPRDRITAVAGREVATWEGTVIAMLDAMLATGDIPLEIDRGNARRTLRLATAGAESRLTEPGELFTGLGMEPFRPVVAPVIDEVTPGDPAAAAGLAPGDRIVAADGVAFESWGDWVEFVRARPGQAVEVEVLRDGQSVVLPLAIGSDIADGTAVGRIGAAARVPGDLFEGLRATRRYGLVEAVPAALDKTWEMAALTVRMVGRMVTGDVSVKNISGPINIAQFAGYSALGGFVSFVSFLAVVSISLGILNLLPIPMLDGGQIVYQIAEGAKGSPLSERTQVIGQQVGLLLLLLLMSFAVYNDLSRLLG